MESYDFKNQAGVFPITLLFCCIVHHFDATFCFSVGVPEITEDQFFEEFSCISQNQSKKRGQINKEVSKWSFKYYKFYLFLQSNNYDWQLVLRIKEVSILFY